MEKRLMEKSDSIGQDVRLDAAVIARCTVLAVTPSGRSLWVGTVKIEVLLENGTLAAFFKKGEAGDTGRRMMQGTFGAEHAIYEFLPEQSPRPVDWGTYRDEPDMHFYLCEFIEMHDSVPSAHGWAATVSRLHLNSMGRSPTGQFGFHINTHLANIPVNNAWNSSWPAFWAQQMQSLFDQDELLHGSDEEMARLKEMYVTRVIPRFLGPLESDGRVIQPCLIHSDLWPGNIKPAVETGELIMFDSCAYWGHNEGTGYLITGLTTGILTSAIRIADLGICRNPRYKLGPAAIREYFQHVPMSEPTADFDGRNHVYAMKYYALLSVMYFKDKRFRAIFVDEMRSLIGKAGAGEEANM
ncbi:hypothetical protein PG996_005302 [Apiospora saccharicola]|uniref:protein-ribulosamine 3-kinase n=1 Tax=Apiospora saccharicola TaxID=335842 RepID=A0ABR1VL37_9PEZI